MLKIFCLDGRSPRTWQAGSVITDSAIWVDLIEPTPDERQQADELIGIRLPSREQTSALELSSRMFSSEKALRVNIPSFVRAAGDSGPSTPLGFVLTPARLATVRYAASAAFDSVADSLTRPDAPDNGADIFIALLESIVGLSADRIEHLSAELSKLSQRVFSNGPKRRELLRTSLFDVGTMQRQIIQIRAALLGVSRAVTYLCDAPPAWIPNRLHMQFRTIHADIGSLNEFDQQLSDRLQFMLDAVLGFINNDQNDIMRVLTVVSVATVPPMILAGIWGMNFKSIPEYNWEHGYAFGLTMIGLSTLLPLAVFKLKKWF